MDNKFKPSEIITKILISSPSSFVGSFESDSTFLTHAWTSYKHPGAAYTHVETPVSRNAFVFAFEVEPVERKAGVIIPDYSFYGNIVCSYLSLLYGKRFDNHGLLESMGHFNFPNLTNVVNLICDNKLPINSFTPRKSLPVELNLVHFSNFEKMFIDKTIEKKFIQTFTTCCKFYWQALQIVENDPEIAYLNLITAGEVLSNYYEYENNEIVNSEMQGYLNIIEKELEDGLKIRNKIEKEIFGIKAKYVKTLMSLIKEDFFIGNESSDNLRVFDKETISKSIKSAYDLRSKYIHTGITFGGSIKPDFQCNDMCFGIPIYNDKEIEKIFKYAPTFIGLERIMRYVLLKYYESKTEPLNLKK